MYCFNFYINKINATAHIYIPDNIRLNSLMCNYKLCKCKQIWAITLQDIYLFLCCASTHVLQQLFHNWAQFKKCNSVRAAPRWKAYRVLLSRIKPRASVRTARCSWHAAVCLGAAGRCTGSQCQWSGQCPALSPAHEHVRSQLTHGANTQQGRVEWLSCVCVHTHLFPALVNYIRRSWQRLTSNHRSGDSF